MVIVLKKDITEAQKTGIKDFLTKKKYRLNEIEGEEDTVIAAVGRGTADRQELEGLAGVASVIPIARPYKMASREFKRDNTVVEVPNSRGQKIRIGGQRIAVIAGPRAVESREQILSVAKSVAASGAVMLRGGTFGQSSSPYSFQGLGEQGLAYLKEAGECYGLPVVTEIVSPALIPLMNDYVDVYQIGARNMQDFNLLKDVGATGKPVILRRSHSATLEELLMSAEYLLSSGTDKVILCERGIRTFEHATRNTLDLSAVPVLRALTHLPIIVDPSHSVAGHDKIPVMGAASIAAGADGLMLQVHDNPGAALVDGAQSILPEQFDKMMHDIEAFAPVMGRAVAHIRQEAAPKVVVAYSGKRGAYAEQAISRYFDAADAESLAVDSFSDIFQFVTDGKADYGMVPIENSLAGSVYQNYDNFSRFEDVSIVGAVTLNIRHALLGTKGASLADVKNVFSHPQALSQCRKFLDGHRSWALIDSVSTATAAQQVASLKSAENAAIASPVNAQIYGLSVLAEDIEDDPGNFTRFVVIQSNAAVRRRVSRELNIAPNMASFIFKTKNEPGALYNILGIFNTQRLNLTRLESRPIAGEPWRYWFYADAELTPENGDAESCVQRLLGSLREKAEDVRLLGMYAEAHH
ncbi:MAG: 3-deoxy-7-phosphoheptulonate synthase [Treponema sp.]|nr:3-deoxy-7-phosphoheptulonate synthase [Treponema sp.]